MKAAPWSLRCTICYNKFHLGVKMGKGSEAFWGCFFLQARCKCAVAKNYGRLVAENPRCWGPTPVYMLCAVTRCFDFFHPANCQAHLTLAFVLLLLFCHL